MLAWPVAHAVATVELHTPALLFLLPHPLGALRACRLRAYNKSMLLRGISNPAPGLRPNGLWKHPGNSD